MKLYKMKGVGDEVGRSHFNKVKREVSNKWQVFKNQ